LPRPCSTKRRALFALLQIFRGGTVIVTSDSSPANVFEMIDQTQATWTFMVPTMWASMVSSEEIDRFDLGSLRLLLSGGSPLLTNTKDAILRRFRRLASTNSMAPLKSAW